MQFLFVSHFAANPHSGSAGSLLAIGDALRRLGCAVDYEWRVPPRFGWLPASLGTLLDLPRRQLGQIAQRLASRRYDAVIVSQPYAYLAYERLRPAHPDTLFLNRTHGWESRVYEAELRLRWSGRLSLTQQARKQLGAALARHACRRTARTAHGIVAASSRCGTFVRQTYGLSQERVAVIPYGLDPEFRDMPLRSSTPGPARMLFVGNYLPRKGSLVLNAVLPAIAARYPAAAMTFVVDHSDVPTLEDRYRPLFGGRLSVLPWMDRSRLREVYASHHVLLHPSFFEGFGKAWMEAMAAGACVVGFAEGGLPDVARHESEALMCAPGDIEGWRGLLERALSAPAEAAAIGLRARERVRAYTWERTARETVAFCERLRAAT